MRVVDSGVIVAGYASWHEAHAVAFVELRKRPNVVAHSLAEAYSVLTRLPAPHRAKAASVATFLADNFRSGPIGLDPAALRTLITGELSELGIDGGPTYDALIAASVRAEQGTLVTLDRRALATYRRIGCPAELLES